MTAYLLDAVHTHIAQMLSAFILGTQEALISGFLKCLYHLRDGNCRLHIILMYIVELRMGMENVINVVDQILRLTGENPDMDSTAVAKLVLNQGTDPCRSVGFSGLASESEAFKYSY